MSSGNNPLDGPELAFFSFWKPDPPPVPNQHNINFQPIGTMNEVVRRVLRIPYMEIRPCPTIPSARLLWRVGAGVALQIRPEYGQDDMIFTVDCTSAVPDEVFYRLYVLMREQFGVLLLDEGFGGFLSVAEFRQRLKESRDNGH